ncbi:MAG: CBS domain-containing protein [Alphaproteobacteria bacterium]|nr:CBS domain-containing protein [Alphaproteobacteria bacterium]
MTRDFTSLAPDAGIAEVKRILSQDHDADIVVVGADGRLLGMVGFADIKDVTFEAGLDSLLNAKDLLRPGAETLVAEDVLATAEQKMEASNSDRLAVVADDESGRVIGIAHRDRALKAHSTALQIAWRETSGDRRKRPR